MMLVGDCRETLRTLPSARVHCCVTSPPYFGLRNYGDQTGMIGLEPTLDAYIESLVSVFREVRRVLRPDGTLWLNIGDSMAREPGKGQHKPEHTGKQRYIIEDGGGRIANACVPPGLKPKDLIGVPWRVAFALQADGWWLRAAMPWVKRNVMPESVLDRPGRATEMIFLLTPGEQYFYDFYAVRRRAGDIEADGGTRMLRDSDLCLDDDGNILLWNVPTASIGEDHFAAFPESIPEVAITAGTSAKGCCPACGAQLTRVVERERAPTRPGSDTKAAGRAGEAVGNRDPLRHATIYRHVGWEPGCACGGDPAPCTVLDPFMGSGTTALVAERMGRRWIGCELNAEYAEMVERRVREASPLFAGAGP